MVTCTATGKKASLVAHVPSPVGVISKGKQSEVVPDTTHRIDEGLGGVFDLAPAFSEIVVSPDLIKQWLPGILRRSIARGDKLGRSNGHALSHTLSKAGH
jgi:hypothetical protein